MTRWAVSQIIQLRQSYPHQVRIKKWWDRVRAGELKNEATLQLVKELKGETWLESRRTGHRIFGFRTESAKVQFATTLNLPDDGFVRTHKEKLP